MKDGLLGCFFMGAALRPSVSGELEVPVEAKHHAIFSKSSKYPGALPFKSQSWYAIFPVS